MASKRLRGREKTLNHIILLVIAALVVVRIWIGYALGGQIYRLTVLIVGVAAGIAALIVVKMLISHAPAGGNDGSAGEDRIQSLKLS